MPSTTTPSSDAVELVAKPAIKNPVTEVYNKVLDLERTVSQLGGEILKLGDFVNRSNYSNVVLAYLFAKGVTKFQFVRVLMFSPKHVVSFLKTDKGYAVVDVHEEDEMMTVNAEFVDYETFSQLLHDYFVLLREMSSPHAVKEIEEEIKRWSS